ncbi:MAG TPA: response regulator transcription factor [Thermoleophilaceae bacterium]|nr:response regulator transcription factor [Thermoleophilaceae bacterium]
MGLGGTNGSLSRSAGGQRRPAQPSGPLRVVIADDHPFYRQGLARLLSQSGVEVVGQASNGPAAIELVEQTAPEVAVVDLNMPGMSGVEVTRRLNERMPASRVLVVSVSAQEDDVTEAILAGASGYVLKDGPVEEVVAGIKAAAAGESLLSPRIAGTLLERIRDREQLQPELPPIPLSQRELEVLRLVAQGRGDTEIGDTLRIGAGAVTKHISSLLMKLQVENRVQAAMRTVRHRVE